MSDLKKKVLNIFGYFVPYQHKAVRRRQLGILEGKASVVIKEDFKITEEEFLDE